MVTYTASVTVDAAKLSPRIGEIYSDLERSINDPLASWGHSERLEIGHQVQVLVLRIEVEQKLSDKEMEVMRAETETTIRAAMPEHDFRVEPLRRNSREPSSQPVSP